LDILTISLSYGATTLSTLTLSITTLGVAIKTSTSSSASKRSASRCRYAECRYAECRYPECRGIIPYRLAQISQEISISLSLHYVLKLLLINFDILTMSVLFPHPTQQERDCSFFTKKIIIKRVALNKSSLLLLIQK
jgi:hypothetical protein